MKKYFAHVIVPALILIGGLSVYFMVEPLVASLIVEQETIVKLEQMLFNQPERAANCAVGNLLNSYKALNSVAASLSSALKNFLVFGTLSVFIISVAREMHVFNKHKANS